MTPMEKVLKRSASCSLISSLFGGTGYLAASISGMSSAASIGGVFTMAGISFAGGIALSLPYFALRTSLHHFNLLSPSLDSFLEMSFLVSSPAAGAALFGLAIQPYLVCAGLGLLMYGIFLALFTDEKPSVYYAERSCAAP